MCSRKLQATQHVPVTIDPILRRTTSMHQTGITLNQQQISNHHTTIHVGLAL